MSEWKDKNFVMAAVVLDGGALEYASKDLQDNEEVVMAAVAKGRSYTGVHQHGSAG